MEQKQVRHCRFFSQGGCQKGDRCDFLHALPQKVEIKTAIQSLRKKRPLEYMEFSRNKDLYTKVIALERNLLTLFELMSQTDRETLHEQRNESIAHWIFASNQMDLCGTRTLEETFSFINQQYKGKILLTEPLVPVNNTMKLLDLLLTNKPDLTSHLWCNQSILHEWHTLLQSNVSLNAGIMRTQESSLEESLDMLRNILIGVANSMDFSNPVRQFREKIRLVFSAAAFSTFYFLSLRPYLDANERLARILSVNILDAVCPFPFPLSTPSCTKERFLQATKERDPSSLMHFFLDCANFHAESHIYFRAEQL